MVNLEKNIVFSIVENYYKIITKEMLGVYSLEKAKKNKSPEFISAKNCAKFSIDFILDNSTNENEIKKWNNIKTKVESF